MSVLGQTQNLLTQVINNAKVSPKGPLALPVLLDFSTSAELEVDLAYNMQAVNGLDFVQTAFVDNADNPSPLSIIDTVSKQRTIIPAGYQAIIALLSPAPSKYVISTTAITSELVRIFFLNIPLPPMQWPAFTQSQAFTSGGALITQDANLYALTLALSDAMAIPTALMVGAAGMLWNGTNFDQARNNYNVQPSALAAQAVGTLNNAFTNYDARGVILTVVATVVGGGGSLNAKLQAQYGDAAATWIDIPGASIPAIVAPGTAVLQVAPELTPVANVAVSALPPRLMRVQTTVAGASVTRSLSIGFVK